MGKATVLDAPEYTPWLEDLWVKIDAFLRLATWAETRSIIKDYLWLYMVHDEAGKRFFDAVKETNGSRKMQAQVQRPALQLRSC
jgi:hypothetical protein